MIRVPAGLVHLEAAIDVGADDAEKGLDKGIYVEVHRVSESSRIVIGHFRLTPMPGCCGIVVSHGAFLNPNSRHSGLSQPFRDIKEKVAKHYGYSLMIATNDLSNIAGTVSMVRSNYKFVHSFTNSRTKNRIGVGIKDIS